MSDAGESKLLVAAPQPRPVLFTLAALRFPTPLWCAGLIARAQHVSRCRARGEPLRPIDADIERLQRRNDLVASVVDDFLNFNFALQSADQFYEEMEGRFVEVAGG